MSEIQGFGRWGQPQPVQEFGRGFPVVEPQDFGRWGQAQPVREFGKGWPQAGRMEFGKGFPFVDQGWRSPREVPPTVRSFLH